MRQGVLDKKVMTVIRSIRLSKDIKQLVIAKALNIDRSMYCRIEKGEVPFTLDQLQFMSDAIGEPLQKILLIAENNSYK